MAFRKGFKKRIRGPCKKASSCRAVETSGRIQNHLLLLALPAPCEYCMHDAHNESVTMRVSVLASSCKLPRDIGLVPVGFRHWFQLESISAGLDPTGSHAFPHMSTMSLSGDSQPDACRQPVGCTRFHGPKGALAASPHFVQGSFFWLILRTI